MEQAIPFVPTHRHYKGGMYRLISSRVRREGDAARVVLYEDEKGQLWVRPYEEFIGKVTIDNAGLTQVVLRYRQMPGEA